MTTSGKPHQHPSADDPRIMLDGEIGQFESVPPYPPRTEREAEFYHLRDGEMLLQSLIDTPEKVERAGRRQMELEKLYLASGGITGPGRLGEPV